MYLYFWQHYYMYYFYKYIAFSGHFCEEDRNGCSEIQCFEGVECMDVPAPGTGAVCGACPLGYTGDGLNKCYGIIIMSINLCVRIHQLHDQGLIHFSITL